MQEKRHSNSPLEAILADGAHDFGNLSKWLDGAKLVVS